LPLSEVLADGLASRIYAMHLKDRLGDIETDCRNQLHRWLLRIVGASNGPTSLALSCPWRSRPQHQKGKWAPVQDFGHCTVEFSDNTVIG
jgi:hypothetical protein